MALEVGSRLAHYDVTALIGEGGMGQVYQATDTKLNRQVALKILPEAFATDPDRLARFQREAQVLASLNHPGIAAIYGIEEQDDTRALVLELVEGPTLADRISKGPIPLDEALPIAKQIAEALEAAHEAGVIHRDLKPANIKVREDRTVKVLDFGLAKALDPSPTADPSQSPTLTAAATQMGVIMGTAAYMSPEQARGKTVDRRADIWAFGCVFYEMLTGKRVFEGTDTSLILSAVLQREPEWDVLPTEVPAGVVTYLRRCLRKNPRERIHAVADVRLALEGAFETDPVRDRRWSGRLGLGLTVASLGIAAVAVILASGTTMRPDSVATSGPAHFEIRIPELTELTASLSSLALSPDGTTVLFTACPAGCPGEFGMSAYQRTLDRLDAQSIPGTEGAYDLFISPDGRSLGFSTGGPALRTVSLSGGPATTIYDGDFAGGTWGPDDTITIGSASGLLNIPAAGGEPVPVTVVEGTTDHRWPDTLPDGKAVLFTVWDGGDSPEIAVVSLETGEQRSLVGGRYARFARTGHIVFLRDSTLWAVPFDVGELELTGSPVPVMEGVPVSQFALAPDGTLAYLVGEAGAPTRTFVWVDQTGREQPIDVPAGEYYWARLSPDGSRLAIHANDATNADVWVSDLNRRTLGKLTTHQSGDYTPLWSPDGRHIVFTSTRDRPRALYRKRVDSTDPVERLVPVDSTWLAPDAWTPDSSGLVFHYLSADSGWDVGLWSVGAERAEPLLSSPFNERSSALSPDGEWLAYQSDETGRFEVYVQRFPGLGDRVQVSTAGGVQPVWAPDGGELFYRSTSDGTVVGVAAETGQSLTVGASRVVFVDSYVRHETRNYDISPDGTRFLMSKYSVIETQAPQIVIRQGWHNELLARVSPD